METFQETLMRVHGAWLVEAYKQAAHSPDPSTQIGAVLTESSGTRVFYGCNAPTFGAKMEAEDWKDNKYLLVEHAERAAIFNAAAMAGYTSGLTMHCTWAACAECARAIVMSGIKNLVRHAPPRRLIPERWKASVEMGDRIMRAGGVVLTNVDGNLEGAPSVMFDGRLWSPSEGKFE